MDIVKISSGRRGQTCVGLNVDSGLQCSKKTSKAAHVARAERARKWKIGQKGIGMLL